MIRTKILTAEGLVVDGDRALLEQWSRDAGDKLWLDIESKVTEDIRQLLSDLGCDDLAIVDAARTRHPPKIEIFRDNTFILFRGIAQVDADFTVHPQQLAIFVGSNYLITVHRGTSVSVDHLWAQDPESLELSHPGLLAIALLHFASGRYLETLLQFEDRLVDLEDSLLAERSEEAMKELVAHRSRLQRVRRVFSYHLQLSSQLLEEGTPHLGEGPEETYHQRRDLFDRCERLHSLCSMYYEICGDLIEGYISISSHQLNNTMKILTIITAIFVPMGFLAGLYGMNFDYIPELHYKYSYFILLGAMATLATSMIIVFRRMKWL